MTPADYRRLTASQKGAFNARARRVFYEFQAAKQRMELSPRCRFDDFVSECRAAGAMRMLEYLRRDDPEAWGHNPDLDLDEVPKVRH